MCDTFGSRLKATSDKGPHLSCVVFTLCHSAMSLAAKRLGVHYVGIAERMESRSVQDELLQFLDSLRPVKVFVHVSSPCTSGSPLRHLPSKGGVSQADVSWFSEGERLFQVLSLPGRLLPICEKPGCLKSLNDILKPSFRLSKEIP